MPSYLGKCRPPTWPPRRQVRQERGTEPAFAEDWAEADRPARVKRGAAPLDVALTTAFAYSPVACPSACPTAWPPTRPPGRRRGRLPAQPPARAAARPRANLLWQLARRPPAHQPGHVPSCLPQCLPARLRAQPAASLTASPPACLRNWPPAGPPAISTLQLFMLPLLDVVNGHCVCCSEAARINASWLLSLRTFEGQRGFAKELLSDRLFTEAGK